MEGFIKEVHIYLWRNLYVGSGSCKEFTHIYGGIHISSSHISMAGGGSYEGRDSYKEFTCIYDWIHI